MTAQKPTTLYFLRKRLRKYRLPIAIAVAVLAALTGMAVFAYVSVNGERNHALTAKEDASEQRDLARKETTGVREERPSVVAAKRTEEEQRRRAELEVYRSVISEANRLPHEVYCHGISEADRLSQKGMYSEARVLLNTLDSELRGWEYGHLLCRSVRRSFDELLTLKGHSGRVHSIAFSPDGKCLASGSQDQTIKLWDTATGTELLTLKGHSSGVVSVAFSPDGKLLASGSVDKTVKLWNTATGKELLTFKGHSGGVFSVAFSPDGKRLASGSGDTTIKIWDTGIGRKLLTLKGHSDRVHSVVFLPDGRGLASGSADQTTKLWDTVTGEAWSTLKGHSDCVYSVAFLSDVRLLTDSRQMASGSADQTIKLRRLYSDTAQLTLKGHSGGVYSVAFSPDRKRLASGSHDMSIKLWDTVTGEELITIKGHSGTVFSVAFSPDGKRLASGSEDQTIKLWDTKELLTLKGHSRSADSVVFSPDGKRLASGSSDKTIKLWDTVAGKELLTIRGHSSDVSSVAFSPNGKHLASGSRDKTIKVWDAVTGNELLTLKGHSRQVYSVAYSPDGKRLASGSRDKTVKVWDTATGKELLTSKGHSGGVLSVVFSPDGKRLASGCEDKIIKLWDTATGRELLSLRGHVSNVLSVAFSPDGKRLASGSYDRTIKLWDTVTGKELLTLKGHSEGVYSVAFSPDGKRLASGSRDKTVKLWDTATGKELLSLKGHSAGVYSVAFSPDGKRLASGGQNNTIKLWDTIDWTKSPKQIKKDRMARYLPTAYRPIVCLGIGDKEQVVKAPSVAMRFVHVPAGSFVMGCPDSEVEGHNFQKEHKVKLTKGFYIGIHEVTQEQYKAVMGTRPSRHRGDKNPVDSVSWKDAMAFCNRMSIMTGRNISLPTEAQWEYACRAGTTTRFSFGNEKKDLDAYAWYLSNGGGKSHPVGQKKPNPWGLYDMHGNVIELVSDKYVNYSRDSVTDPAYPGGGKGMHVWRGGSIKHDERGCRSAQRTFSGGPDDRRSDTGFRVICIPNTNAQPQTRPTEGAAKPAKPPPVQVSNGSGGLKLVLSELAQAPAGPKRTATLRWLIEHLRSEVLPDLARLWASEAPNGPDEQLFRQAVAKLGEGKWHEVLLNSLNAEKFAARGSALAVLAARGEEIGLLKRVKLMTAKTVSTQAIQIFAEKFGYVPANGTELLACVTLSAGGKDSLDAPARLARQWGEKYKYKFNIRDFHLLSRLAADPLRNKIGRNELIKQAVTKLGRRRHVAQAGIPFFKQAARMTMPDLWNIVLLDEMLAGQRVSLGLKVLADRLRAGLNSQRSGLVFYEGGQASAKMYPQATDSTRGDRDHIPDRELQRAGFDAICHLHTRFEKVYNGNLAPTSKHELSLSRGGNFYGLILTSVDPGTFSAFYYNPDGEVVSLGLFAFSKLLKIRPTTKPTKSRPVEILKPRPIDVSKPRVCDIF